MVAQKYIAAGVAHNVGRTAFNAFRGRVVNRLVWLDSCTGLPIILIRPILPINTTARTARAAQKSGR